MTSRRKIESVAPADQECRFLHDAIADALRAAAGTLGSSKAKQGIHATRILLKRARAALRLLEQHDSRPAREIRRKISGVGRSLGATRDVDVVGSTAASVARLQGRKTLAFACQLRVASKAGPLSASDRRRHAATLAESLRRFERSPRPALSVVSLIGCISRSVKRVKKQAARAGDSGKPAAVHDWRKSVIVLREQVSVLLPVLPGTASSLHPRLRNLARQLGRANDSRLLMRAIKDRKPPTGLRRGARKLLKLTRKRRKEQLRIAWTSWKSLRPALDKLLAGSGTADRRA